MGKMKFMPLLFVAFMFPIAGGAIVFESNPELDVGMVAPGVYDLSVVSSAPPEPELYVALTANGAFELLDVQYPPEYTFEEYEYDFFGDGMYWWGLFLNPVPVPSPVGVVLEMTFNFPQVVSDFEFILEDDSFQTVDNLYFVVAPEPATLSLLTLGGLLLCRRK